METADRRGGRVTRRHVTRPRRAPRRPWLGRVHTPSIAFRHPPPNSARFSYATEGVLFISAQLSSVAVISALRKVQITVEATLRQSTHVNMT